MNEYIKGDVLMRALMYGLLAELPYSLRRPLAEKMVEDIAKVDAVEVVRCKDCKFNKGHNKCLNEHSIIDIPKDDDYCSYGERKDEDNA
jgi:hypothetical protein